MEIEQALRQVDEQVVVEFALLVARRAAGRVAVEGVERLLVAAELCWQEASPANIAALSALLEAEVVIALPARTGVERGSGELAVASAAETAERAAHCVRNWVCGTGDVTYEGGQCAARAALVAGWAADRPELDSTLHANGEIRRELRRAGLYGEEARQIVDLIRLAYQESDEQVIAVAAALSGEWDGELSTLVGAVRGALSPL